MIQDVTLALQTIDLFREVCTAGLRGGYVTDSDKPRSVKSVFFGRG